MKLKTLLERIALQRKEEFPYPDDLESYLEDFVPNTLLKSETLQKAFGITDYEMETLYEEAHEAYEINRYVEAANTFRWLVFFNSYEPKYWMGYGACQQMLKRYEKALEAYAVAALLDSDNPYPHYYAYECNKLLNNMEDAGKALTLAYRRCEGKAAYVQLKNTIKQLKESENGILCTASNPHS